VRQGDRPGVGHHRSGRGAPHRPDPTLVMGEPPATPRTEFLPPPHGGEPPHGGPVLGGRYRLTGRLGASAPVESHHGIDLRLNRPVTVALFPPATDPAAERRFESEAQALANLNHPGLAAVYDFGIERGGAYLVSEPAEGSPLFGLLGRRSLPPTDVARMGAEIANVLSYLHDCGIVHGHLSPANVVLDPSGMVRLTGFGFGPLLEATGFGPAHAAGDSTADVHALGLMLLEAVTGDPRATVPRDLDEPLRRALTGMTAMAPARRPTARQVEAMLAAVEPDERPDEVPDDDRRAPRGPTTRLVIAVGLVVLLAVVVGAALTYWRDTPEEPQAGAPASTSQDRGDDPGLSVPQIPDFEAPDLPEMPNLPTEIPDLPEVPDSVSEDARNVWDQFVDWLSRTF
jgi:eukaryotic-like serine/threonine-protein kinase